MEAARQVNRRGRFERLVTEVYRPVQRYLLRRTDPATADDVLGEVLLVLWRRLDDVPLDTPLPWVYGVARGCLANILRSAARQERLVHRLAQVRADAGRDDGDLEQRCWPCLPQTVRSFGSGRGSSCRPGSWP